MKDFQESNNYLFEKRKEKKIKCTHICLIQTLAITYTSTQSSHGTNNKLLDMRIKETILSMA